MMRVNSVSGYPSPRSLTFWLAVARVCGGPGGGGQVRTSASSCVPGCLQRVAGCGTDCRSGSTLFHRPHSHPGRWPAHLQQKPQPQSDMCAHTNLQILLRNLAAPAKVSWRLSESSLDQGWVERGYCTRRKRVTYFTKNKEFWEELIAYFPLYDKGQI
jgi:hypothetical protein